MSIVRSLRSLRIWGILCVLLGCIGLFSQPASADRDHHRPPTYHRHHRHRVVQHVRVKRHGHWVTVIRVVFR